MAVALPLRRGPRPLDAGALTAALYREHAAELLRFAWHRLGRVEDAEDAVQTTFLSAHRVLQGGEDVREPRAWLFRILRNECLTRLALAKRRGSHDELGDWHADPGASVHEQMELRDEFDTAVALLATLPVQQREAIVLREWLGLSAIETAAVLDATPQGVDALVYRARKALLGLDQVEPESACAAVRGALADGRIAAPARAHLLACRGCRQAARRLHAPEELAAARGILPLDAIAARLGEAIPGFLGAGAAALAVGGGAAAIAGGTAVKVATAVAIGAVVAGGAVRGAPAVEQAFGVAPAHAQRAAAASAAAPTRPASADGAAKVADPAPTRAAAPREPQRDDARRPTEPIADDAPGRGDDVAGWRPGIAAGDDEAPMGGDPLREPSDDGADDLPERGRGDGDAVAAPPRPDSHGEDGEEASEMPARERGDGADSGRKPDDGERDARPPKADDGERDARPPKADDGERDARPPKADDGAVAPAAGAPPRGDEGAGDAGRPRHEGGRDREQGRPPRATDGGADD